MVTFNKSIPFNIYAQADPESAEQNELDQEEVGSPFVGEGTYQEKNSAVKRRKTEDWQTNLAGGDGTYMQSKVKGSKAWLRFRGNSVSVVLRRRGNTGIARIIVRDVAAKTNIVNKLEDLYKGGAALFQTYTFGNLNPSKTYRITVKVTGDKNALANNSFIGIDKFVVGAAPSSTPTPTSFSNPTPTGEVEPTDIPDPENDADTVAEDDAEDAEIESLMAGAPFAVAGTNGAANTYENTSPYIRYKKTWQTDVPMPTPLSGSYAESNQKGAVAIIKFKGKKVSVFLRKGPNAGKAFIKLKKVGGTADKKTKELYKKGKVKFRKVTYDNLDPKATYIIRVRVTGKKNTASSGTVVGVDKFVIEGEAIKPPSVTISQGGPTLTPTPTGTDDDDDGSWLTKYDIPIGTKQSLTIHIGGTSPSVTTDPSISPSVSPSVTVSPDTPYVTFTSKLYGTERNPEIKVRLKITDLIAVVTPAPVADDFNACQNPKVGEFFVDGLVLVADGGTGVYIVKPGTTYTIRRGDGDDVSGTVSSDGWIALTGVTKGKRYSLTLKGPKHVAKLMEENVELAEGKPNAQNFSWSSKPLDPGDVPDPSEGNLQNCVVNAADVSLVKNRMNKSDLSEEDLMVADLDYNNAVNAGDMALLTRTLSTKA
ncbi:hypothetical protein HY468_02800, partial [Candidatus Roizmanbacteria bacterium]|nr:hypothetical protein [Candidatus Roizmanbacteria bacterium]